LYCHAVFLFAAQTTAYKSHRSNLTTESALIIAKEILIGSTDNFIAITYSVSPSGVMNKCGLEMF
jgi:hypothetical protein